MFVLKKILHFCATHMNNYRINNKTINFGVIIFWYFLDFRSDQQQDPDPYQNETDPQHCMLFRITAPLNDYCF